MALQHCVIACAHCLRPYVQQIIQQYALAFRQREHRRHFQGTSLGQSGSQSIRKRANVLAGNQLI
jgi:hypothetical protein